MNNTAASKKTHLTDKVVTDLPFAAPGARYEVYDASVPNFGVRVGPRSKTFILRRRAGGSRNSRRQTIGAFPDMDTIAARTQAGDWDEQARRGLDPAAARAAEAAAKAAKAAAELRKERSAFRQVMGDYIASLPSRDRNLNAVQDMAFLTRNFLNPDTNPWIDSPIHLVTDAGVASLIKQIKQRAPVQAYHALTHIKTFFGWAMDPDNRCQIGLERNPVADLTHRRLKLTVNDRTRVLEYEEVAAFLAAGTETPYPYGPCLRTLIETGQRSGAVKKMRWSQINFARKMWVMTSKGAEHHVPLSNRMIELLRSLRETLPAGHGDFVFSFTGGQTPIDKLSDLRLEKSAKAGGENGGGTQGRFERRMLEALDALWPGKNLDDWVWHDVRRTVRTHLEPITGREEVAEAAIGHSPTGIVRVYNLYKYRAEIRRAFNKWSELLHKIELGTCTLEEWEHDDGEDHGR
ncbi:integrase family protein [Rhizobium sp. BK060]|uniref:tyrosine-type recombinase/integrase n=1 Tax=Rhizobium sp. BK060 TaxID=2587096 RepID=UPI001610CF3E|nr:integrase family protein [Rhizobium sp. BK060]MBB3398834.1 integrase [Rhizobium sp. BK060]